MDDTLNIDNLLLQETNSVEFKRDFPKQASSLAKEIAAFASSGGGKVILGVDDDRSIAGIAGISTIEGQKALRERVEGICAHSISPPCSVELQFRQIGAKYIAIILVPSGPDELYYSSGRPFIRVMSISRPATPQEVREKIIISDLRQRLEKLEQAATLSQSVAAGIIGQGELATKNMSDIMKELARRERRRIP